MNKNLNKCKVLKRYDMQNSIMLHVNNTIVIIIEYSHSVSKNEIILHIIMSYFCIILVLINLRLFTSIYNSSFLHQHIITIVLNIKYLITRRYYILFIVYTIKDYQSQKWRHVTMAWSPRQYCILLF